MASPKRSFAIKMVIINGVALLICVAAGVGLSALIGVEITSTVVFAQILPAAVVGGAIGLLISRFFN